MDEKTVTSSLLQAFAQQLRQDERSAATVDKYMRDVRKFAAYAGSRLLDKALVVDYKQALQEEGYAVRSVNSMLAAVNTFLEFLGHPECRVKALRVQRQTYSAEEKELTRAEYLRLLDAAPKNGMVHTVLQTICGTGIRVSELKYFTLEAVRQGQITVRCKSKIRTILIPGKLKTLLLRYAKSSGIAGGCIFRGRSGRPLDRCWIWTQMKKLCSRAGVASSKVFPHNLRKLFARSFYSLDRDIAKLADILGHSSIETTRIYIITTGSEHRKKIEQLKLVQ